MAHILIVEDEQSINDLLKFSLERVGHTVNQAYTGMEALKLAEKVDLVLLDIMLPGLDGFTVKEKLPQDLPVIFVTAKTGLTDKLKGLQLGADDYITKPFEILEVLARVETVLRRTRKNQQEFVFKDLLVDLGGRRVYQQGKEVELTPQEFSLLEALIVNRNLALSREQLLAAAWGYDYEGETRTVDVHIQRLRKKLSLEQEIQTVYKLGYRLNTRS